MYSACSDQLKLAGFPHSEISGSRVVCTSPELIAAYHVLHRLHAPRHPPCALSSLTIEFAHRKLDQHIVLLRLVPLEYLNRLWTIPGTQKNIYFLSFGNFAYSIIKEHYNKTSTTTLALPNSDKRKPEHARSPNHSLSDLCRRRRVDGGGEGIRTPDPMVANHVLCQLSYTPGTNSELPIRNMVGLGGFELPTSPLSGVRSNQLSYRPAGLFAAK